MTVRAVAYWDRGARTAPAKYSATTSKALGPGFTQSGAVDLVNFAALFGVDVGPDMTVVEIGCGAGRMTGAFAQRVRRVHAADISPGMLDVAKTQLMAFDNIDYLTLPGDGTLPLPDGVADIVFSYVTMQHVNRAEAQLRYLREAARVVKPGGMVLLQYRQDTLRARTLTLLSHVRNLVRGVDVFPKAWRGGWVRRRDLRALAPEVGLFSHLTIDDRYLWIVASPRDPSRGA